MGPADPDRLLAVDHRADPRAGVQRCHARDAGGSDGLHGLRERSAGLLPAHHRGAGKPRGHGSPDDGSAGSVRRSPAAARRCRRVDRTLGGRHHCDLGAALPHHVDGRGRYLSALVSHARIPLPSPFPAGHASGPGHSGGGSPEPHPARRVGGTAVTRDELERALANLPFRLLRRLGRSIAGPPALRMGKRRLMHTIMAGAEANIARREATIRNPHAEQQGPAPRPAPAGGAYSEHKSGKPADLRALLEGIGVPEPRPFVPDDWQMEAGEAPGTGDGIVSVPTGSRQTYVAVEATRRAMHEDRTVVYTSPLKALSYTK